MAGVNKAAIVGATGPTGSHLAPLLQEWSQHARAISRSKSNLRNRFPDDAIEKVAADATDEAETVRALDGCDVVYDCIGMPVDRMAQHPVTARNIEGLSVGQFEQGLVVRGFALVKESARAVGPMDT